MPHGTPWKHHIPYVPPNQEIFAEVHDRAVAAPPAFPREDFFFFFYLIQFISPTTGNCFVSKRIDIHLIITNTAMSFNHIFHW
jgi:hypothetical protein